MSPSSGLSHHPTKHLLVKKMLYRLKIPLKHMYVLATKRLKAMGHQQLPTSNIQYPTSNIQHPTSPYIFYGTLIKGEPLI
jgi:hypothetical protein